MNSLKGTIVATMASVLALGSTVVNADRGNKYEFTLQVPYLYQETIDFDGGANVRVNSDAGFGFSAGFNYSDNLNLRGSFTWNSTSYNAERVLDDGNNTVENIGGVFDSFTANLMADYYFLDGPITPFINGNIGWTTVDSNIAAGPPNSVCWWDPWWGYICDYYQPTYGDDSFSYGIGAGVRFDISNQHFIRAGYYERWLDVDNAIDDPTFGTLSVEFGFMY
ncbi:outer membrane protein [Gilvimarinus agarilyticus]|uniref:outer membrane protein n=1 Tax=Gilvimarinus agarilyticus TaxID=679259 RepID=UPI0005A1349F|nr:outer membrane beta-barrel protein [Gilvimarinus agarilyticus]